jgi:hypothetical protein
MESMQRYISPINPNYYSLISLILLTAGCIFTGKLNFYFMFFDGGLIYTYFFLAFFFVLEVSREKNNSKQNLIFKELLIAIFASLFLGFGIVFLCNSVGIYV